MDAISMERPRLADMVSEQLMKGKCSIAPVYGFRISYKLPEISQPFEGEFNPNQLNRLNGADIFGKKSIPYAGHIPSTQQAPCLILRGPVVLTEGEKYVDGREVKQGARAHIEYQLESGMKEERKHLSTYLPDDAMELTEMVNVIGGSRYTEGMVNLSAGKVEDCVNLVYGALLEGFKQLPPTEGTVFRIYVKHEMWNPVIEKIMKDLEEAISAYRPRTQTPDAPPTAQPPTPAPPRKEK